MTALILRVFVHIFDTQNTHIALNQSFKSKGILTMYIYKLI